MPQILQRLTLLALDVQGLLTLLLVSLSSGVSSNFVVTVPAVHQRVNKQAMSVVPWHNNRRAVSDSHLKQPSLLKCMAAWISAWTPD